MLLSTLVLVRRRNQKHQEELLAQNETEKAYKLFVGSNFEDALANSLVNGYVLAVSVEVMLAKGENETALQYCEKIIEKLTKESGIKRLCYIIILVKTEGYDVSRFVIEKAIQKETDDRKLEILNKTLSNRSH